MKISECMRTVFIVFILFLMFNHAESSNATPHVIIENDSYKIFHYHDYSRGRDEQHRNVHKCGANSIFNDSINTFSYIKVLNKKSDKIVFTQACPPYTDLIITDDNKYIIGLNNSRTGLSYQIVVYDISGNVLFKKKILDMPVRITSKKLKDFAIQFPTQFKIFIENNSLSFHDSIWFIQPQLNRELRDSSYNAYFLIKDYTIKEHKFYYRASKRENYGKWYDSDSLFFEIVSNSDNQIEKITFRGTDGKMKKFKISEEVFSPEYFIQKGIMNKNQLEHSSQSPFCTCRNSNDLIYYYLKFNNHDEYSISIKDLIEQDYFDFQENLKQANSYFEVDSYDLTYTVYSSNGEKQKHKKIKGSRIPKSFKRDMIKSKRTVKFYVEPNTACVTNNKRDVRPLGTHRFYIIRN